LTDLRYGVRLLSKNPAFTIVAVLSLALGIGATTAMFSVVDATLLKPLAYVEPERLVMVWEQTPDSSETIPTAATFLAWREHQQVFSNLATITSAGGDLNLTGEGLAERIRGEFVSANYFEMLGVQPSLGRAFREAEEQPGNERVAVLSHRFWQRRFGADPEVLGGVITLNNESLTIVGVLPAGSVFDREAAEVWLPLVFKPADLNRQFFSATARLKPGITLEQANAELKRLSEGLEQQGLVRSKNHVAFAQPLREHLVRAGLRRIMLLLLGAVSFILLIACANVANLLLARGAVRKREIAIRAALGASWARLMRQFLTESMLLALIGGGAGALLAVWLIKAFSALTPAFTLPIEAQVALDWRVLLFTLGASLLSGAVFGVAPAWQAARVNLTRTIQERGSGASARWSRNKSRSLLLVTQLALTCVLVIGAALLIRSFSRLLAVEPGFQRERMLMLQTNLDAAHYPQAHQLLAYQTELLTRMRALPGVEAAAAASSLPLGGVSSNAVIRIAGRAAGEPESVEPAALRVVSPDYFRALGASLLRGRSLSERDTAQTDPVAVINQTLAKRRWPERDPLGEQVLFPTSRFTNIPLTIVGVTADLKHWGLDDARTGSEIYLAFAQLPEKMLDSPHGRSLYFVARTNVDPAGLKSAVQSLAAGLDENQPIYRLRTMEEAIASSVAAPRFRAILFSLFGGLALILAAAGVYGAMAYAVSQRTREIGIRVALGAQRSDVLKLVMGQGLALTFAGLAMGLAGAFALTRYLASLLFEVKPADFVTYVTVSLVLAAVAIVACYVPARRALKVSPTVALREE
jgi:putative ABC transport system permease protein